MKKEVEGEKSFGLVACIGEVDFFFFPHSFEFTCGTSGKPLWTQGEAGRTSL